MSLLDAPKATYGGTYRAVCLEVLPDRVRAQVPQVFADTVVTIFEFAGAKPLEGDEGWVTFESGLAERPVWVGSENGLAIPTGGPDGTVLTKRSAVDRDVDWEPPLPVGGADGQVLTRQFDGSAAWEAIPQFSGFTRALNTTSDITYPVGVGVTEIPLSTVLNANGPAFTPNFSNTRFTVPSSGSYDISAYVAAPSTPWPVNDVVPLLLVNGIAVARDYPSGPTTNLAFESRTISTTRWLNAGDYVTLAVYTTATATTIRALGPVGTVLDPVQPYLSVWATGQGPPGPQGPVGPDITLVQSSYLYGHLISPASIPGTFALMGWTTDLANNITLPSATNVTFPAAGRYRVAVQISTQTSGAGGTALTTRITLFSASGATKFARDTVNPLTGTSGAWGTAFAEAIFDVAATDYVQVQVVGTGATSVPDPRSWIEVTPIGGTKGDKGDPGESGVLALASWWFSSFTGLIGGGSYPAGTLKQLAFNVATQSQNFTRLADTSAAVCGAPGKYEITVNLTAQATALLTWFVPTLRVYKAATSWVTYDEYSDVGPGVPSGTFTAGAITAVVDLNLNDRVEVFANTSSTATHDTRSWISIVPVGGNKGDPGVAGATGPSGGPVPAGGTAGQTIVKVNSTDGAVAWDDRIGRCITRRYGTQTALATAAFGGAFVLIIAFTNAVTLTVGRIYRVQFTARAATAGLYVRLRRDSADFIIPGTTGVSDFYSPVSRTGATDQPYGGINAEWLIVGDGTPHIWSIVGTSAAASAGNVYNDSGGHFAIFDAGPDPGNN